MLSSIRNLLIATVLATGSLTATSALAQPAKAPETAADHEALAKAYEEKAASYRKDAEWHKQMAEEYAKTAPQVKGGKNPWAVKMQKHCAALAKEAEKLADDAQKAADFHKLRAQEMKGK